LTSGTHFFVWRQHKGVPFQHHAIDLGDGTIVHFTNGDGGVAGLDGDSANFEILRTPLASLVGKRHVIEHQNCLPPETVCERAISQVGRKGYHLLFDNCEHFAFWCVVDRDESRQVSVACERLSAAGLKAVATGTVRVATHFGVKRLLRGVSPWLLAADAAQWITEAGGHHVGIRDPLRRKQAGQAIGISTALGIGACAGPAGVVVAGGLWIAGEVASEVSRNAYEQVRRRRGVTAS
jgi:Lecithin retinol acyltransferase